MLRRLKYISKNISNFDVKTKSELKEEIWEYFIYGNSIDEKSEDFTIPQKSN